MGSLWIRTGLLFWIGLSLTVCKPGAAFGQDLQAQQQATEQRLAELKEQISNDQERLAEAAEAEEASLKTLDNLKREIALREELVSTYATRRRQLEADREALADTLGTLETRLDALREDYRARAVHAYKYGRIPNVALILGSTSINQMLVRARYLRQFADERRTHREEMQTAAAEVRERRDALADKRERIEQLLAEAQSERQNLSRLQSQRRSVIRELRAQRSELREEIEEKQSQAKQLESRIRELIAEAEARATAEETTAGRNEREAEWENLSASFEDNQGRLPWPASGAITEKFGNRVDPVHGTTTYHPGILIATQPGEPVRAVFEGTVSGIDFVPGYGTYLVLRHGKYLSVYSNFSRLNVTTGQDVSAGQVLGQSGTSNEPRGAGIFFAVFDTSQSESVDPTSWLASR